MDLLKTTNNFLQLVLIVKQKQNQYFLDLVSHQKQESASIYLL